MTAIEIFNELRSRGVTVEAAGDRIRIDAPRGALTPELRSAISEQKAELILLVSSSDSEIAWRVKAMLPQVPNIGPIPFLTAREEVESQKGCCLSCGDPLETCDAFRCAYCGRAANLALELSMSLQHSTTKNEE